MLKDEFKIWSVNLFLDTTFIIVGIHVINLGYLKNRSLCFIKLSDDGTKEINKILIRLNIDVVISETDDQYLLDLIDLKTEQAKKKKKKVEKC